MQRYENVVIDTNGVPQSGIQVDVFLTGTTTPASIFSDDGVTSTPNPTFTDAAGRFHFFVADGKYDLKLSGARFTTYTISNIEIADITEKNSGDTNASIGVMTNCNLTGALNGNTVSLLNYQKNKAAITGNAADQALYTYTLPANLLSAAGKSIMLHWASTHSTGTAAVTYKIKLNGVTLATFTGSATASATIIAHAVIAYNTSTTGDIFAWGNDDALKANTSTNGTGSLNFAASQTLEVDFNVANTDQVTPKSFLVELIQ